MNLDELVNLTKWIDDEIKGRQIPKLYNNLARLLQNVASGQASPFSDEKDELVANLRSVNLLLLTNEQRDFVSKLNLLNHIGTVGANELEGILFKNSLDISTASSRVATIDSEVQEAIRRSDEIKASLKALVTTEEEPSDQILIRVSFQGGASINDIVQFKKWAAAWHDIGRGIAMSVGSTPQDIRVVSAQKGSIIITLATVYGIAQVVATVLMKSLEVTEKILNIKKAILEIESLKLSNSKVLVELKASVEEERKNGSASIASETKKLINSNMTEESETLLEGSVKKLLDFMEKGGEVDVVLPIQNSEDEDSEINSAITPLTTLRASVYRIRELESKIKSIEFYSSEE